MTSTQDLTPDEIDAIAALANVPAVAEAWADWQNARQNARNGTAAGGARTATLAVDAAKGRWVEALRAAGKDAGVL